ncbi:putative RNA-binding protein (KH domain) [Campylobacter blaseri]|uniref:RNA-binding protein n=1 Tax=Campylobacter blaseri TaxID=2042961 RepID=A0A2P8R0R8_9BACT|nr:KH domain-containing protein [Campylobacter blaseri]PSM52087.1 RNA-binding protein [Campylobacter blaseri]PSM53872.1 RNA-binding protein [Campylobacter blaseri]QKF85759.1 putative RNA-binding protein (KH domain) [Campylobacter blaseri]
MIKEFLKQYAMLIAEYPEKVTIEEIQHEDNFVEIIITADKSDTGKLIGRDGRIINAIKTVISAYKSKNKTSYKVNIKALEE